MTSPETSDEPFPQEPPQDFRVQRRVRIQSNLLDRLPPHSLENEQGILGCILTNPIGALEDCEGKIVAEDFYDLRHQTIFQTFFDMRADGLPIELISVQQTLKDKSQLEAVGGTAYLTALMDIPSAGNLSYYIAIVMEKAVLRRTMAAAGNAIAKIHEAEGEGADVVLADIEKEFEAVRDMRSRASEGRIINSKIVVREFTAWCEQRCLTKGALSGLSTGFPDLDKLTDGIQFGELTLLAARPGAGKTSIAIDIAAHVAVLSDKPKGVLFVSIEMSPRSLVRRMTSGLSGVLMSKMKDGSYDHGRELSAISSAAAKIMRAPLHFIDAIGGITCGEIAGLITAARKKFKVELIIVDYIQKVRPTKVHSRRDLEIAEVGETIRGAAHRNHVACICLAQLRREADREKSGQRPSLSSLRESGSLEQDGDLITFLHRKPVPEDFDPSGGFPVEMLVSKQRDGAVGCVDLFFQPHYCHFVSAAKVEPEPAPAKAKAKPATNGHHDDEDPHWWKREQQ